MSITTLSLFKAQLNIEATNTADDELLQHKLNAAENWVQRHCGIFTFTAPLAPVLTEATLQIAALWYEQREAATFGSSGAAVPYGVYEMLGSYREAVTGNLDHSPSY